LIRSACGSYVKPEWKEALVSDASQHLGELQQDIKAEGLFGNGDVPGAFSHAAKQTKAHVPVTECYPYGGNLRIHGYAIICAVPIPVVSVWGCDSLRTAPRGVLNYWRKSDG